jgi:pimeloyl-ACP methyl ester carboxylesterase
MILTVFLVLAALLCVGAGVTVVGTAAIERAHPAAGRFVEVTGARLHYVELGAGEATAMDRPAVVIIHGASGNLEDMRVALGERLSARYRVILIDRPGHGWSERGAGTDQASPARQAAMIHEALDRLGIKRIILVAHSWAGALGTAFTLAHPENVAGLVLLAPVTHPWTTGIAWHYQLASVPIVGPLFAHTLALPLGALLVEPAVGVVFSPQPVPENYVSRTAVRLGLRPAEFLANAADVAGLLAFVTAQAPRYREITVPVVIFAGDRDVTVSPRIHSQALAAMLPQAKLVMLENVGHMPHYAVPERIVAAIDEIAAGENRTHASLK